MAKQIHVSMTMDADVRQAKAKIADLQNQLQSIKFAPSNLFNDTDLKKASQAASELQQHLKAAMNVDTGKLNLTQFSMSLQKSGKTLKDYRKDLELIGPAGQQAFISVAQSVASAEAPTLRLNKKMTEFLTTLKNTARWQISSSILHGFMGSVSNAYSYAQKLDKSLNNIRIVTGKSAEEMTEFAKQANMSAKALSASTTAYTDAALIFYQQGLEGDAVTKRADAVIKMSNVTGESAEDVSSYMTAIWNNFANGSKELEYYADVITALGAATASSTDEIAAGLEKFAAISETVGLSYEYATTALATVTAETRQSADVVGTAFKTIFSRIQGLQLGETLEDGTDLNKYSSALLAVGVNIKDANGELKDMDVILNELGAKWQTLHKDEQLALAQTVAGVRQYNQLIALMDNWDVFNQNLDVANNSEGELNKQAKIYADSWEAAQKRVQAAAEEIYDTLIDEEFFKDLANAFEKILNSVNGLINGLGGVKGILGTVGGLITQHFAKEAPVALGKLKESFMFLTGQADKLAQQSLQHIGEAASNGTFQQGADVYNTQLMGLTQVSKLKEELIIKQRTFNETERLAAENQIKQVEQYYVMLEALSQQIQQKRILLQLQQQELISKKTDDKKIKNSENAINDSNDYTIANEAMAEIEQVGKTIAKQVKQWTEQKDTIKDLRKEILQYIKNLVSCGNVTAEFAQKLEKSDKSAEDLLKTMKEMSQESSNYEGLISVAGDDDGQGVNYASAQASALVASENLTNNGFTQEDLDNLKAKARAIGTEVGNVHSNVLGLNQDFKGLGEHTVTVSEKIGSLAGSLMSLSGLLNSIKTSVSTILSEDTSAIDKVTAGIGILVTGLTTYVSLNETLVKLLPKKTAAQVASAGADKVAKGAIDANTTSTVTNAAAWYAHPIMWIVAIIMAVVAAIGILSAVQENQRKKHEEEAKAAEEEAKALREVKKANEELTKSYQDIYGEYVSSGKKTEELRENALKLADAYKDEQLKLYALTEQYEKYNARLKDVQGQELEKLLTKERLAADKNAEVFEDQMREGTGAFIGGNYTATMGSIFTPTANEKIVADTISSLGSKYVSYDSANAQANIKTGQTAEEMLAAYNEVQAIVESIREQAGDNTEILDNSKIYQDMINWLEKTEEAATAYKTNLENIESYKIEKIFQDSETDKEKIKTIEDYNALYDELVNKVAKENNITKENANEWAKIEESVKAYLGNVEGINELQGINDGISALASEYNISEDTMRDYYNNLDEDSQKAFLEIDFDIYKTKEEWDNAIKTIQALADSTAINLSFSMENAFNEIEKDGLSSETKSKLQSQFTGIMDTEDWNNFDLSTPIEQTQMLADAQSRLAQSSIEARKSAEESRNELSSNVTDLQAKIKELEEKRNSATDSRSFAGYTSDLKQLSNQLDLELQQLEQLDKQLQDMSWDNLGTDILVESANALAEIADRSYDATSLIGEGYKVAAEDVKELARIMPELLVQAENNADGTLTLNKEIVKAHLDGNEAMIKGDAEVLKANIENKITVAEAELKANQTKLDALDAYLEGEITASDMEQKLAEADATLKSEYIAAVGEDAYNAAVEAAENNEELTNTTLSNLDKIGLKAKAVGEAIAQALAGEDVTFTAGDMSATGASLEASDYVSKVKDVMGEDAEAYIQEVLDQKAQLEAQIESGTQNVADLKAALAALNASSDRALSSIGNVNSGKSGEIKTDKNSGKEKEKDIKKLDDEIDRYHAIKELLEDIGVELNRIQKKKDRAWGGGKLAAINEETAALKQQLSALKQYQSQIESNLSKDKGALGKYGWSLDGNGNVSNYEANMARLVNQWNNSAQEDADKEYFENAKKALQQYEESKDLYDDVIDQITDATYALADAELEAIEYSVEIHLELDDNKLKLLEDIMETIGDSAARAVDNIEMIEKSIDTVLHQMETSKDGMKSIFDYIGLSGDVANRIMNGTASESDQKTLAEILNSYGGAIDMDRVVSDLQQYQDNLLSYNEALRNYRDQVFETVNNAFSEHLEDFDRANDKIAHCVSLVSGYKDLIEAIGRKNIDVHGELTQKLNQALEAQAEDAHRAALAKEKYAQSAYQEALEGYQTAIETGDEYAINKWTEILESTQDELQAAKEDSQAALTEWANAIAESFSSAIQQVIDDLDTALGGLKLLREDFDMAQEIDAQYLDDYEKIYQLSKLTREVQASIDETDNVAAKKALMEYQSKINAYQQQGVQMSQYELDYLRAQYELELARIALEESKNAKSQVSMVKDAEGNYSYVYTADDEAVAQAEQTYEDKLYEMQRLNGDYINELQSNIIAMQEEMSAKLQEIADNDLLSYEEKMIRMDEVRSYYLQRINFYDSQLGISIENNKNLYENEWQDYHDKTGYKISANSDYVDSWDETTLAIISNVETQKEYLDNIKEAIDIATEKAESCCQRAEEALNEAGMTTEELGDTISRTTDELIRDADDAARSAEQMSQEYQFAMQEIMNAATAFTSSYASMITNTITQNQNLINSMQEVINMAIQMKATLASASVSSSNSGSGNSPGGGNNPGGNGNGDTKSEAKAIIQGVNAGRIGGGGAWQGAAKSMGYSSSAISMALRALNDSKPGGGYSYDYAKALALVDSYDTGGYTGNWGTSEGRLALLHQKELVLNAQDTPNILDAVGIVRDIAKAIDINALSAMVNGGLTAATFSSGKNETLEQNVHITAEFPNAIDKHEILEAFDNVINLAAQYANRK